LTARTLATLSVCLVVADTRGRSVYCVQCVWSSWIPACVPFIRARPTGVAVSEAQNGPPCTGSVWAQVRYATHPDREDRLRRRLWLCASLVGSRRRLSFGPPQRRGGPQKVFWSSSPRLCGGGRPSLYRTLRHEGHTLVLLVVVSRGCERRRVCSRFWAHPSGSS